MRVIVTGSREWTDRQVLENLLDIILLRSPEDECFTVIHGACKEGADRLADNWVLDLQVLTGDGDEPEVDVERHPAAWQEHGRMAGHIRNRHMASLGADLCLAFSVAWPPTPGTASMIDKAHRAGIPVLAYIQGGEPCTSSVSIPV